MILDLTELRQDYKSTYKKNWPLARKIEILIEISKISTEISISGGLRELQSLRYSISPKNHCEQFRDGNNFIRTRGCRELLPRKKDIPPDSTSHYLLNL